LYKNPVPKGEEEYKLPIYKSQRKDNDDIEEYKAYEYVDNRDHDWEGGLTRTMLEKEKMLNAIKEKIGQLTREKIKELEQKDANVMNSGSKHDESALENVKENKNVEEVKKETVDVKK